MMDCAGYRDLMVADVHEALSPREASAVRDHLATCAECRNARALEVEVGALLRRPSSIHEAPPQLRARVVAALAEVEVATRAARWRRLAGVATIAAVGLAALALLSLLMLTGSALAPIATSRRFSRRLGHTLNLCRIPRTEENVS